MLIYGVWYRAGFESYFWLVVLRLVVFVGLVMCRVAMFEIEGALRRKRVGGFYLGVFFIYDCVD